MSNERVLSKMLPYLPFSVISVHYSFSNWYLKQEVTYVMMGMSFYFLPPAPRYSMRTMRSLSCERKKSPGVYISKYRGHILPSSQFGHRPDSSHFPLIISSLHSPGSSTTQLHINLALLKAVWSENKTSKHMSHYYPLEQEGCVS